MVNIQIQRKDLYLLSVIVVFLIGVGFVVAYNPDWRTNPVDPNIHGHSPDEAGVNIRILQANEDTTDAWGRTLRSDREFAFVCNTTGYEEYRAIGCTIADKNKIGQSVSCYTSEEAGNSKCNFYRYGAGTIDVLFTCTCAKGMTVNYA